MALFLTILFGFIVGVLSTFYFCKKVVRSSYVKKSEYDELYAYLSAEPAPPEVGGHA